MVGMWSNFIKFTFTNTIDKFQNMQIGWIDFSDNDRKRAIDVIHLLQEQGAMDELGIGIIRDAISNRFFPGTSTIQTRAKYFFIIPYIIKECCENKHTKNVYDVFNLIDKNEKWCAQKMKDSGDIEGVIGADVIPQRWVVRRPYSIYWNGIRKFGIFTNSKMSLKEYVHTALRIKSKSIDSNWKTDGEENAQDDKYAGKDSLNPFWNLPNEYNEHWKDNLRIELLPHEAKWLRNRILASTEGSLLKFVLGNNISLKKYLSVDNPFEALYCDIKDKVDDKMARAMLFAYQFNYLVYMCRILYNMILSDNQNADANEQWGSHYPADISKFENLDIKELFLEFNVKSSSAYRFLCDMKKYLTQGDIENARKRIVDREIELKDESRAKLLRKNEYDNNIWIGGYYLDYRMGVSEKLLNDIYSVEGKHYV